MKKTCTAIPENTVSLRIWFCNFGSVNLLKNIQDDHITIVKVNCIKVNSIHVYKKDVDSVSWFLILDRKVHTYINVLIRGLFWGRHITVDYVIVALLGWVVVSVGTEVSFGFRLEDLSLPRLGQIGNVASAPLHRRGSRVLDHLFRVTSATWDMGVKVRKTNTLFM